MDKIPGQIGFLILNEDGAVLNSGGDLENDEHLAEVLYSLVCTISKKNVLPAASHTNFQRMSLYYSTHVYSIALSNKKFHIVKRKYVPLEPVTA